MAYPDRGDDWVTEEVELHPSTQTRAVADAEASAERFTQSGGRGVALRFAAFYGPSDVVTEDFLTAVKHGFFPVLGHREAFLPMVHHEDASSAVVTALDAPAGVYNVADDEPLRRGRIAVVAADLLGVKPPVLLPAWLASITGPVGKTISRSVRLSNRKLRGAGWAPMFPSAVEGLQAVLAADRGAKRRYGPIRPQEHPAH